MQSVDGEVREAMVTLRLREGVAYTRDDPWEVVFLNVPQKDYARSCWSCLAEPGETHDHWCHVHE